MIPSKNVGRSAKVRLQLRVSGRAVPLSQIGPDFCISREPIDLSPQAAEIIAEIDSDRHVHAVYLPKGMSASSPRTTIEDRVTAAD